VIPVEVDEGEEPGALAVDRADQRRVEEGEVVGRHDEWWIGETAAPVDGETPGDSGTGANGG
jgi:hypothetical protein